MNFATSCHLWLLFCGWPSSFFWQNPAHTKYKKNKRHWKPLNSEQIHKVTNLPLQIFGCFSKGWSVICEIKTPNLFNILNHHKITFHDKVQQPICHPTKKVNTLGLIDGYVRITSLSLYLSSKTGVQHAKSLDCSHYVSISIMDSLKCH